MPWPLGLEVDAGVVGLAGLDGDHQARGSRVLAYRRTHLIADPYCGGNSLRHIEILQIQEVFRGAFSADGGHNLNGQKQDKTCQASGGTHRRSLHGVEKRTVGEPKPAAGMGSCRFAGSSSRSRDN